MRFIQDQNKRKVSQGDLFCIVAIFIVHLWEEPEAGKGL